MFMLKVKIQDHIYLLWMETGQKVQDLIQPFYWWYNANICKGGIKESDIT